MYTNADLKMFLCVCVHIKTIPEKFCYPNPKNSQRILELSVKFVDFFKNYDNFYLILLCLNAYNKLFTYLTFAYLRT